MTSGAHADLGDLGPELRKLAQTILDGLDPAVRTAAMLIVGDEPGKCQQVWCPVCALVALVSGQEHPLLTIIAEHSVALLAVIRSAVGEPGGTPPPAGPPDGGGGVGAATAGKAGYERIPVTVQE